MSEDEARRKLQKPRVGLGQAAKVVRELYGVAADVGASKRLESYDDANFYIREAKRDDGHPPREFVCKYMNGVETGKKGLLEAQNAMLVHLAKAGFKVPTPQPLKSSSLSSSSSSSPPFYGIVDATDKEQQGVRHAVRLFTWVSGRLLCDAILTPEVLERCGEYLGRLNCSLDSFDQGAKLKREHLWDLQYFELVEKPQFAKALEGDEPKQLLLAESMKRYRGNVLPLAKAGKLRTGLIHGDFNDANIVMDVDGEKVGGAIDFGDSNFSWKVNDPAIALGYIIIAITKADSKKMKGFNLNPPAEAMESFVKGFTKCYELNADEKKVLLDLAACRVATSATIGWYSASLDPSDPYLKFHAEPAWKALKVLLSM